MQGALKNIVWHELQMEMKSKATWSAVLLYVLAANLICYLTFKTFDQPIYWNGVFWLVLSFTCLNASSQIFKESPEQILFAHQFIGAKQLFLGKLIYNLILTGMIGLLNLVIFSIFFEAKMINAFLFGLNVVIGALLMGSVLTVTSAIAYKAAKGSALNNILSIPLLIPIVVLLLSSSNQLMQNVQFKDFIHLEIYENETFPVIVEVKAQGDIVKAIDSEGHERKVNLFGEAAIGKQYQAEAKYNGSDQRLDVHIIKPHSWQQNGVWTKVALSGVLLIGIVILGWLIFPYFWYSN